MAEPQKTPKENQPAKGSDELSQEELDQMAGGRGHSSGHSPHHKKGHDHSHEHGHEHGGESEHGHTGGKK